MDRHSGFMNKFTDSGGIADEHILQQTIVEIAGEHRVLVENHRGVVHYSRNKICIRSKNAVLNICGCGLLLMKMTKDQIVITGKIEAVNYTGKENV